MVAGVQWRPWAASAAALVLVLTSACTRTTATPLPGASAALGTAASVAGAAAPAEDLVFVIPLGTAAAQMRGDPDAYTLPPEIDVVVGQRIVVRNQDNAMHYFFYMPIAPGQEVVKTFDQPGQYGYSSLFSCSIGKPESVGVRVAPRYATGR